jgi:hypothetical protein
VRGHAAHQQRVLFHEAEAARRHLPRARNLTNPPRRRRHARKGARARGHAAGARQDVERGALAQQNAPRRAAHHRHAAGCSENSTLLHSPLHRAAKGLEHSAEKGHAREHRAAHRAAARRPGAALVQKVRLHGRVAYNQATNVKRGGVFSKPLAH